MPLQELIKIYKKMIEIIVSLLREHLSQTLLREYLKTNFLLRKLSLKQADRKIDFKDLDRVYQSSLLDILEEIVRGDLFPSKKELDPLHAMIDEPERESINLRHVYQNFRIVILENYKEFLINFLDRFSQH